MELFQLRSFLQVARVGNVTRAAEELCLTQPAVTQHIRGLERELGAVLVERTGRGVRLTQAGEALRDHARRGLAVIDECRQVISDIESGNTGRLSIGAGVTVAISPLPGWIAAFGRKFPGVEVDVRTGRSNEVARFVLGREIELGLVTSPVSDPELTVTAVSQNEVILVASPQHDLAASSIAASALADAPLILFPRGTGFRSYLDSVFESVGITPRIKMETDSVEAIKSFVAMGLGVSFLPVLALSQELEQGTLVRCGVNDLPTLVRTVSAIRRTDRYLTTAADGFLSTLRAH